ncbi:hypothetical protein [Chryseobacterium sp. OSA05B]|uniref:hypothetical protein n=1 Tax=Chryseobacterium sp. OSA05B TaxID=2862650 RepID=UPI001CBDD49F|nr:hypothetical protein [Chryseobacterium sp. OSA05B]
MKKNKVNLLAIISLLFFDQVIIAQKKEVLFEQEKIEIQNIIGAPTKNINQLNQSLGINIKKVELFRKFEISPILFALPLFKENNYKNIENFIMQNHIKQPVFNNFAPSLPKDNSDYNPFNNSVQLFEFRWGN